MAHWLIVVMHQTQLTTVVFCTNPAGRVLQILIGDKIFETGSPAGNSLPGL